MKRDSIGTRKWSALSPLILVEPREPLVRALPWVPPLTYHLGIRRIIDINDHVLVPGKSGKRSGRVDVPTAGVEVPMGAGRPRLPVPQLDRILRISNIPDQKAVLGRRVSRHRTPARRHVLKSRDHLAIRDLNLDCPRV